MGPKSKVHYWHGFGSPVRQGILFSQSQHLVQILLRWPKRNCLHQHLRIHYKLQTLAVIPLSGHTTTHNTPVGMGSAALPAAGVIARMTHILHKIKINNFLILFSVHHTLVHHMTLSVCLHGSYRSVDLGVKTTWCLRIAHQKRRNLAEVFDIKWNRVDIRLPPRHCLPS